MRMQEIIRSAHPSSAIDAYAALTSRYWNTFQMFFRTMLLVALFLFLYVVAGCHNRGHLMPVRRQAPTSVLVQTPCGAGSGVIVSPTQVLTARHVLGNEHGGPCGSLFIVSDGKGNAWAARLEIAVDVDLARLVILEGQPPLSNATSKPRTAKARGLVCFNPSWPPQDIGTRKCGIVTRVNETHWGLKYAGEHTIPGNSGSGLWDISGRLVGIITCTHPLGGCATSLATRKWLVP